MIPGLDPAAVLLLCLAAAGAGWVDAVSGGGGLLQLPSLLVAVPQAAPAAALGTNKLASIIGTTGAATTYVRTSVVDLRTALPMALAAIMGSAIGASLATRIPAAAFRPAIWLLLVGVWLWTLLRPQLGAEQRLRWPGRRRHYVVAVAAGFGIGCYDGLLGPGTGSFLLMVLVAGLGYSFLNASATAKIVNAGTNLAALIVFGLAGSVLWGLGLLMGACNLAGAIIGARMAIRRGSAFVRVVFLAVVGILIARLGWEIVAPLVGSRTS
ncbi:MAG: TSUP family transporter [Actinomycetales bacterium]|nr:TSUP family transporter [Actinomycetales bacterium]